MTNKIDSSGAVWLVTGCSSGFGKSLSGLLAKKGIRVAATARQPQAIIQPPGQKCVGA